MSKTIEEQISGKCIHFNGLMNKECKKGIKYEDVKVPDARPIQIPCTVNTMFSGGSCEFCQFPTPEEVRKQVEEISDMGLGGIKAMIAVKDHYKKTKEPAGVVECPKCKGRLHYTRAEINGHFWAKCSSCGLSFME